MGGFEAEVGAVQLYRVSAEHAAVGPGIDDLRAERRVASAAVGAVDGDSRGRAYAFVQRLGKVRRDDFAREFADQFRPALEFGVDARGEAAGDAELLELALERVLAAHADAE